MTIALILVALTALLVHGLDRNHDPNRVRMSRLAGNGGGAEDRDLARLRAELTALDAEAARPLIRETARAVSARTATRVRPASATR